MYCTNAASDKTAQTFLELVSPVKLDIHCIYKQVSFL